MSSSNMRCRQRSTEVKVVCHQVPTRQKIAKSSNSLPIPRKDGRDTEAADREETKWTKFIAEYGIETVGAQIEGVGHYGKSNRVTRGQGKRDDRRETKAVIGERRQNEPSASALFGTPCTSIVRRYLRVVAN